MVAKKRSSLKVSYQSSNYLNKKLSASILSIFASTICRYVLQNDQLDLSEFN